MEWANLTQSWYEWVDAVTKNRPRIEVSYDRDIQGKPVMDVLSTMSSAFQSIGCPALKPASTIATLERQDLEPLYQNRVANWAAFEAQLNSSAEGKALLDWAQTVP